MTRADAGWPVLILALLGAGPAGASPQGGLVARKPGGTSAAPSQARARFLMGTILEIAVSSGADDAVFEDAFAEVDRLESVISNWRQESELALLNRTAAKGPVRCSAALLSAVEAALHFARLTDGAFDPTVEPLVRRLGLRPPDDLMPGVPADPESVRSPRDAPAGSAPAGPIGWKHVVLDRRAGTIRFDAEGVGIDLGGIGKGIALDAAARVLARHGVRCARLDFGGQVLAIGAPQGGRGWRVDVAAPGHRDRGADSVLLKDASISSSGNDERSVGTVSTVGHIVDPARRAPASFDGSVAVVSSTATEADALSTALFVMGPQRGAPWAESRGVGTLFLRPRPDGGLERIETTAFRALEDGKETFDNEPVMRRHGR